ncbi:MAG TPA: lysylphosphatidylglycerol synthase transmembrane domain-containing protein, partial [Bryobacteraceae bacterium]
MSAAARTKRRFGYWVIALVVAGVALYLSLRGIDWREVWRLISHAAPAYLVLSLALGSASLFLRAVRWRLLLAWGAPVRLASAFVATAVGYCGNLFLPARAGELIRTLMISRASGLSKTFVLTTALCERLSDAIALVLISSVALLLLPVKPGWFSRAATPFAVIGLAGVFAIAILPRLGHVCRRWGSRLPISSSIQARLFSAIDHVLAGLRAFHDAKRLFLFISLTGVVWLADAWTVIFVMRALGLSATLTIA